MGQAVPPWRAYVAGKLYYGGFGSNYRLTNFYDSIDTRNGSFEGTLFGYFESDQIARAGSMTFYSAAEASALPAVPEPQTYLMMLAGVAVLTGARKLRKS